MRQLFLPFLLAVISVFGLNGCTDDVIINADNPRASLVYDFWAGSRSVEVDGEIFNDGNTRISEVEIEIMLFDEFGQYITSVFQTFPVNLRPYDSFIFATDFRARNVFDVEVEIVSFW